MKGHEVTREAYSFTYSMKAQWQQMLPLKAERHGPSSILSGQRG